MNFIEQALQRRCSQGINISKLVLDIPYAVGCSSEGSILVDRWIGYSLKSNIKHLTLHVFNTVFWYSLPPTLFSSNSLTMLELTGCKMELPLDRNIKLPLKKLRFSLCHLDDECFQNLIHSCPDLEDLKIVLCQGLKRMMIPHLLKLKNFLLNDIESIEIEAPMNLEEFFYFGNYIPCPINVWACQNLRTLSLYNMTITENWFHCLLSKLPLLSSLSLSGCNRLEKLKISGHSLTRLSILCLKNLAHVIIHTPNLLDFGYHGDIISFSFNAPRLLKVGFDLETKVVDDSWHFRKVEFLAKFSHCKAVIFLSESKSYMDVLIPKALRESLVPPLYNVKHLSLSIHNGFKSLVPNAAVDLIDGLLWICPHLETLTIRLGLIKKSIKFLYEEVMDNEGNLCPCCKSLPIGCWRHCLKKVVVENTLWISKSEIKHFNGFEDETNLKKFFLENAKFLERMDDFTYCKLKNRSWWATLM